MCDWRMKMINKRAGGVRERSSEGKSATIFITRDISTAKLGTSTPAAFAIILNVIEQCPSSSSMCPSIFPLQYQLVHHGRQGPCRQRAVHSSRQRVDDGVATSSNVPASSRLSTSPPTNGTKPCSFASVTWNWIC